MNLRRNATSRNDWLSLVKVSTIHKVTPARNLSRLMYHTLSGKQQLHQAIYIDPASDDGIQAGVIPPGDHLRGGSLSAKRRRHTELNVVPVQVSATSGEGNHNIESHFSLEALAGAETSRGEIIRLRRPNRRLQWDVRDRLSVLVRPALIFDRMAP